MANPKTKRSFGFIGRYASARRLSSTTHVIRDGIAEAILAAGCSGYKLSEWVGLNLQAGFRRRRV
jgi:hypothetical protein